MTGVRPIRVSGVGYQDSGDGREARDKRQCKSANRDGVAVQRCKSGGKRRERREAGGSGKVQTCKRAKVEGIRGRVDKWDGGQGEARGSAKVQIATESLCKGGNVQR